jgi:hypothetical protein
MNLQEALVAAGLAASVQPASTAPPRIFCGATGKRSYPDRGAALDAVRRNPDAWSSTLAHPYNCGACGGVHLSSKSR